MRVVIADDHEVVRVGLRTILRHSGEGYELVGEATSGSELLKVLAEAACDLAIVDFLMTEDDAPLDGVVLLRELRRRHPKLRIVVLTLLRNPALFKTMYMEGVGAVVEKSSMVEELLIALRAVRSGRTYIGKHIQELLLGSNDLAMNKREDGDASRSVLSAREAEVVRMFAHGRTITEIATLTHRSVKTISRQKRSAMAKLGITNDRQLFEYARMNGFYGE